MQWNQPDGGQGTCSRLQSCLPACCLGGRPPTCHAPHSSLWADFPAATASLSPQEACPAPRGRSLPGPREARRRRPPHCRSRAHRGIPYASSPPARAAARGSDGVRGLVGGAGWQKRCNDTSMVGSERHLVRAIPTHHAMASTAASFLRSGVRGLARIVARGRVAQTRRRARAARARRASMRATRCGGGAVKGANPFPVIRHATMHGGGTAGPPSLLVHLKATRHRRGDRAARRCRSPRMSDGDVPLRTTRGRCDHSARRREDTARRGEAPHRWCPWVECPYHASPQIDGPPSLPHRPTRAPGRPSPRTTAPLQIGSASEAHKYRIALLRPC
eukprot:353179-Chlamydomonas_euryale.AAC.3